MKETVFEAAGVGEESIAIVFGAGYAGIMAMHVLRENYRVHAIRCFDNDSGKHGKTFFGNIVCEKPTGSSSPARRICVFISIYNETSADQIEEQCRSMGYAEVFKVTRLDIARETMSMSDERFLEVAYYASLGMVLDIAHPRTYNEKLQWLKLNDHTEAYRDLTDKIAAKQIVSNLIGEQYVLPVLGQWDCFDEVDFKALPNEFVLKCNHDSGTATIVDGKSTLDMVKLKRKYDEAMSYDYYLAGREWNYKGIPRHIFAEPKLTNADGEEVKDYKVFTFDGIPKLVQVDYERFSHHTRAMYSPSWDWLGFSTDYPLRKDAEPEPEKLGEILELSKVLSKDFKHVRVDWYVVNGKIFFGEMTFHHGGGMERFSDESWNFRMGDWLGVLG